MTDDPNHNFANLVGSARSGDKGSLDELAGLFHKEIFRMVYVRTGSRMDAEDLTQEIFLEMAKNLHHLKDATRFKPWLYRIAVNKAKDFHRKRALGSFFSTRAVQDTDPPSDSKSALDNVLEKEFWHQFHGLARQLSRKEGEVFALRYVDQLGIREIAEVLKSNKSTVKTHLYRALRKFKQASGLRALLEEVCHEREKHTSER